MTRDDLTELNQLSGRITQMLRRYGVGGADVGPVVSVRGVIQPPVEYANDPARSNLSGAASMPVTMIGFTVNETGVLALPANIRRGYLMIQNNSNADLLVGFGGSATPGAAFVIGPGSYYEPRVCPTNDVYLAALGAGTRNAIVVEGSR